MPTKQLVCLLLLAATGSGASAQTGTLSGKVTDKADTAPIPGVQVVVKRNGVVKGLTSTNEKGVYYIASLAPLRYTVEFLNLAYASIKAERVTIAPGKTRLLNAGMLAHTGEMAPRVIGCFPLSLWPLGQSGDVMRAPFISHPSTRSKDLNGFKLPYFHHPVAWQP